MNQYYPPRPTRSVASTKIRVEDLRIASSGTDGPQPEPSEIKLVPSSVQPGQTFLAARVDRPLVARARAAHADGLIVLLEIRRRQATSGVGVDAVPAPYAALAELGISHSVAKRAIRALEAADILAVESKGKSRSLHVRITDPGIAPPKRRPGK